MGTCFRPSYTASVWPTNSGRTVERRDQVLITRRSRDWLRLRTFSARCSSTNGPFFCDRTIGCPGLLILLAPLHDERVAALRLACPVPQRRLAPRGHRTGHADR